MVKRENLVIWRMLGARLTPNHGEVVKVDQVPPWNYLNVMVWKDLGHSFALGDKIPMKGIPFKSNGEVKNAFYYKTPQIACLSHVTQTQKCLYKDYTK